MPQIALNNQVYSFEQLPSAPATLIELVDLCHDEAGNFAALAAAVEKDPALTAKIIQVANSAQFRQWNEVTDIRRMLVVLGINSVKKIVISSAVLQFFANFSNQFDHHLQGAWFRALVNANLARRLAQLTGYQQPQEAYLGGLLYQVGQLLLLLNHPAEYQPLLEQYDQRGDFCLQEKKLFGSDHCELGAALVESWQIDSFLADAILFQKAPTEQLRTAPALVKIVAVASALNSAGSRQVSRSALDRAGRLFDLTESSTFECLTAAAEEARQTIRELNDDQQFSTLTGELAGTNPLFSEPANNRLGERIKQLALAGCHTPPTDCSISQLVNSVRTSFEILFHIDALFLLVPDQQDKLTILDQNGITRLSEIRFDQQDPTSSLVKAFTQQTLHDSFHNQPAIIDQQLIRLLQTEGATYLPLQQQNIPLGVIALGTSTVQARQLRDHAGLLKLMAVNIADSWPAQIEPAAEPAGISFDQLKKITHEVSNPLTIIKNYLYVLSKKIDAEADAQQELAFINEEIDRVGNILLRAKQPEDEPLENAQQVDLNRLLQDLERILSDSLFATQKIKTHLSLDETIPLLSCCRDKLKQILINLLKNASEACPGGTLQIKTRDGIYQNDTEYVEISIKDDGPGIPRQILQNLFKPVQSTKPGHSGVGLAIAGKLTRELSGRISCCSSPEEGTEFSILLPRLPATKAMEPLHVVD